MPLNNIYYPDQVKGFGINLSGGAQSEAAEEAVEETVEEAGDGEEE